MRSGMRSWSKCVIFSRRMKSSSSVGPRSPAFSEFWLSPTPTPWLVVSIWPVESTRTRSSEAFVGLVPGVAPLPVFAEALLSLSVLAPTSTDPGSTVAPTGGETALARPCSFALLALNGIAATSECVAAIFSAAASPAVADGGLAGLLAVLRDAAFAATAFLPPSAGEPEADLESDFFIQYLDGVDVCSEGLLRWTAQRRSIGLAHHGCVASSSRRMGTGLGVG